MDNINISLPRTLKKQSEKLVKLGYYASFSDLVRSSLRNTLRESVYDVWADEAKRELASGEALILRDSKDIDDMMDVAEEYDA